MLCNLFHQASSPLSHVQAPMYVSQGDLAIAEEFKKELPIRHNGMGIMKQEEIVSLVLSCNSELFSLSAS